MFVFFPVFLRELVKLQREVMSAETALEQKRMARHNLLLACKVQSLPVTLLSGSLDEVSEAQVRRRIFSSSPLNSGFIYSYIGARRGRM